MDYSGKDTVLDVVHTERAKFYNIVDNPDNWYVQTRCSEWEVRDIAGHMIDVTEGYLSRWDMARKGEAADALGLQIMSERLNQNAQAFRSLSRAEAIARLKVFTILPSSVPTARRLSISTRECWVCHWLWSNPASMSQTRPTSTSTQAMDG
jgi:hypothetical protein